MISKDDVLSYIKQISDKINELDTFYGEMFSQVQDAEFKELFLRLQGEEKSHLELLKKLQELFVNNWKE